MRIKVCIITAGVLILSLCGCQARETQIDLETSSRGNSFVAGRIMAVDLELNLVMISVGDNDNLAPDSYAFIMRDNIHVGTIKIDKIETDASFGHTEHPLSIQVCIGDRVIIFREPGYGLYELKLYTSAN